MSGEEACSNLNQICATSGQPWNLTYSFGRALQYPALEIWGGRTENVERAQSALLHRLRMSSAALSGEYSAELDRAT
jgi:fructose-bisphosphate aldolase class I